ncbi:MULTISPECIES: helix-turn-helix domain-containing protein [Methylobacterium]|uniref:Pyocin large subunit n=2 Tax=Methylobacterium TaxID=407 RepID=A0A0C6F6N1_9HYPH|nr:helix-turn-helix domain-containing protein [Methylobacterium aquaticum]BAQ43993.1 pyocin large subunit [Methylobacterium aquaticum]
MSFQALAWARSVKTGSSTLKAVLVALASYSDADGRAFPSQDRLAEDTEFTSRAVRGAIATLVERGFISREQRWRKDGSRATDLLTLNVGFVPSLNRNEVPGGEGIPERRSAPPERPSTQEEPRSKPPEGRSALTTFEQPENYQKELPPESGARAGAWPADFWEQFQAAYPHLVKLRGTLRLLREIQAEGGTRFEDILDGIARYVASRPADRNWLGSDKFLEDRRFEDRPAPLPATGRQPPLSGQAARLAQLAQTFQGGSDVAASTQPSQRRAYGTRGSYGGGQPVQWTSGDDARPSAEVLLIADRRAYAGRA